MSFFRTPTSTFGRGPKVRKTSDKWVRLETEVEPVQKWVDLEQKEKPEKPRKAMNKVSKKTIWWNFINAVLTKFFLRISLPQRCERCDGTAYCGELTPAHTRRRSTIKIGDFYHSTRVAALGADICHADADHRKRDDSEEIIDKIITERFERMNISEEKALSMLKSCAIDVLDEDAIKDKPRWQHFRHFFQTEPPYLIDTNDPVWTVEAVETQ